MSIILKTIISYILGNFLDFFQEKGENQSLLHFAQK